MPDYAVELRMLALVAFSIGLGVVFGMPGEQILGALVCGAGIGASAASLWEVARG